MKIPKMKRSSNSKNLDRKSGSIYGFKLLHIPSPHGHLPAVFIAPDQPHLEIYLLDSG
jgi:hypothetical protein